MPQKSNSIQVVTDIGAQYCFWRREVFVVFRCRSSLAVRESGFRAMGDWVWVSGKALQATHLLKQSSLAPLAAELAVGPVLQRLLGTTSVTPIER